ncbi:UTRA domain-containing protein, partial [Escherichia coli]|uniref:UTRA domain-containing protein n=2 Tax=Bacteria TaxID=2 RepID=UPI003BA0F3F3
DSFQLDGKKQSIRLLDYQVVPANADIQEELFLSNTDFVYQIKRLRLIDDQPFMIETGFIPIKIVPTLSPAVVNSSIFNYLEDTKGKRVTKS